VNLQLLQQQQHTNSRPQQLPNNLTTTILPSLKSSSYCDPYSPPPLPGLSGTLLGGHCGGSVLGPSSGNGKQGDSELSSEYQNTLNMFSHLRYLMIL
jgi:hypothetical protein